MTTHPIEQALLRPLPQAGAETLPLVVLADFPATPAGWAYLHTAATSQKPQPVIDAITRGYARDYATVHRGVYQRSADMTLAYEAARRRVERDADARDPPADHEHVERIVGRAGPQGVQHRRALERHWLDCWRWTRHRPDATRYLV